MNTIVQSSNCQIVKSICYFTISLCLQLSRAKTIVLYLPLSAFNSLYLQSKRCLRKLNNFTISLFKASPFGEVWWGFLLGEVWRGFPSAISLLSDAAPFALSSS